MVSSTQAGEDEGRADRRWAGSLRREIGSGASVAIVTLTISLASGALAYAPLGPEFAGRAAEAAIYAAVFGGGVAALAGTSSVLCSNPRASVALVHGTIAALLVGAAGAAWSPESLVLGMSACLLLAGVLQFFFGVLGIGRIISFAPHSVLSGFINGVALVIILSQLKGFLPRTGEGFGAILTGTAWGSLLFACLLAAAVILIPRLTKRVSNIAAGFGLGVLAYQAIRAIAPGLELGGTLGTVSIDLAPGSPFLQLRDERAWALLASEWASIAMVAITLSLVMTLDSLLVFRVAQNLHEAFVEPRRDLAAQGLGNCASAFVGGVAIAAAPSQALMAFRAGARTRLVPLSGVVLIAGVLAAAPSLLALVPRVVLSALLLAIAYQMFDRGTLKLLKGAIQSHRVGRSTRAWSDLAVVLVVMLTTAGVSVVAGVLAGVALACVIFIVSMSRPVVRRGFFGDQLASKRMRSAGDAAVLQRSGRARAVLELQGVLFFGNADNLANEVRDLFGSADMIVLDFRGISEVDVSGAAILRTLAERSKAGGKKLMFCNVPAEHLATVQELSAGAKVFADLDTALEWMEERALETQSRSHSGSESVSLSDHDLVRGLGPSEVAILEGYLKRQEFGPAETLCVEGEDADSMWLLVEGSVSVRLRLPGDTGSRRIAGLASGTVVGDLAFIERGKRSAMVAADDHAVCYMLERTAFDQILAEHPRIATTVLTNLARELGRRLRKTSDELRQVTS